MLVLLVSTGSIGVSGIVQPVSVSVVLPINQNHAFIILSNNSTLFVSVAVTSSCVCSVDLTVRLFPLLNVTHWVFVQPSNLIQPNAKSIAVMDAVWFSSSTALTITFTFNSL